MATILIIDDDETFRSTLAATLTVSGHSVVIAANGFEGANCYRANPTDVVFVDMVMPHDGLALIRVLRSQFAAIKIIAMSGGSPRRLGVARDLGVHCTLVKPFTSKQLTAAIADTLAARTDDPSP